MTHLRIVAVAVAGMLAAALIGYLALGTNTALMPYNGLIRFVGIGFCFGIILWSLARKRTRRPPPRI